MKYMKETTSDWKVDFRVPCHTYIMDKNRCVGYIKEGTTEEIMFNKPSSKFDQRNRTFEEVKPWNVN